MILKFQQGGTAPLLSFEPVVITGGVTAATTEKSSGKSSDLTDKDLLEMLQKLDGLPSDMAVLTKSLQDFYIDEQYNPFPSTSNIASRYINILQQLKTANYNHEQYKVAQDQVIKNGGINEYAIDEHGRLYCMNQEGDFKLLTTEQLQQNTGYQALTNAELLHFRAYNMAGKNDILKVVKNGIGMESVSKMIRDNITNLGTTQDGSESYAKTKATAMIKGLNDFIKASENSDNSYNATVESLYKSKLLTKTQAAQAQEACEYLWATLPENARTLLKLKSGTGEVKGGKALMMKLIRSTQDSTSEFSLDLEETPSTSKGKDGSSSKKSGFEMDPVQLLQNGYGQKQTITIQTGSGGSYGIELNTVRMPIVNKEGKSIGASATLDDVTTSGFSGYLDFENASMGGTMIPTVGFNNIAINGTALYTGYLPIDIKEYNTSGNIKPDINMLARFKEAQRRLAQENITDPKQINAVYQEYGLPVMYNGQGAVLTNYKKFGMINATALESAFNTDVSFDDYLHETTDENIIENTLTILNKGRGEKDRIDFDSQSFIDSVLGTDYDHVYKGTIFIPVNEDYFTSTAGFGNYPTPQEAEVAEAKQQAQKRSEAANNSYVNPGRL